MAQKNINPVEVIFLAMTNGNNILKKFPAYYENLYHSNPKLLLENALENNFLIKKNEFEKSINKLKVIELKEILNESNLANSGKKTELIQRIINEVPKSKLTKLFPDEYYCLTENGELFINENDFAVIYHKHKNISHYLSLDEYYKLCLNRAPMNSLEIIINYLNKKADDEFSQENWENYKNIFSLLLNISKKIEYKATLCFLEINFLATLSKEVLPTKDELNDFKNIYSKQINIFNSFSTFYNRSETLKIILLAVDLGVWNIKKNYLKEVPKLENKEIISNITISIQLETIETDNNNYIGSSNNLIIEELSENIYPENDDHEVVNLKIAQEHVLKEFPNSTSPNSVFYGKLIIALIFWIVLVYFYMKF